MRTRQPSATPLPGDTGVGSVGVDLSSALVRVSGADEGSVRLVLVLFLALLVWTHGRAVLRGLALLGLAGTVTIWAIARRMFRYLATWLRWSSSSPPLVPPPRVNGHSLGKPPKSSAAIRIAEEQLRRPVLQTSEILPSLREVWRLHEDCYALKAASLLSAVDAAIAADPSSSAARDASRELTSRASTAAAIRGRLVATKEALKLFEEDEGWSGSIEVLGSHTRFRREDGRMTLKIEGVIDGVKLGDVLAVWREIEHFDAWLPSCTGSRLLRSVGRGDVLFHMDISVLGGVLVRDAVVHAYSVDALDEASCVLFIGKSVGAHDMPDATVPPPVSGVLRLQYRRLQVLLEPLSETRTRACMILCLDPQLRLLPTAWVEGVLRRTICMIFWLLKRAALKIGEREGRHYDAIRADPDFYEGYLAPRLRQYFERLRGAPSGFGAAG